MAEIVLDAGPLIAIERGERPVVAFLESFLDEDVAAVVPAGALAQVWRDGSSQALLARFLSGCLVDPMDSDLAKAAGVLCGKSSTSDVVDASVVMTAVRHRSMVLTDDVDDIQPLADIVGVMVIPTPRT